MAAPVGLLRLASPNHYLWLDSVHLHAMSENATQAASSTYAPILLLECLLHVVRVFDSSCAVLRNIVRWSGRSLAPTKQSTFPMIWGAVEVL